MLQVERLFSEQSGKLVESGLVVRNVRVTEVVAPDEAERGPEHGEEFLRAKVMRVQNESFTERRPGGLSS